MSNVQGFAKFALHSFGWHFCGSDKAITVLVSSGYGISVLPEIMIPAPRLAKVDIRDASLLSFGIYYKSLHAAPSLSAFADEAKAVFLSAR